MVNGMQKLIEVFHEGAYKHFIVHEAKVLLVVDMIYSM